MVRLRPWSWSQRRGRGQALRRGQWWRGMKQGRLPHPKMVRLLPGPWSQWRGRGQVRRRGRWWRRMKQGRLSHFFYFFYFFLTKTYPSIFLRRASAFSPGRAFSLRVRCAPATLPWVVQELGDDLEVGPCGCLFLCDWGGGGRCPTFHPSPSPCKSLWGLSLF